MAQESIDNRPYEIPEKAAQFVGFYLGDQQYAFPIEQIQRIVILDQVTPTPQVAEFVEGVSNLRGEIIPVINLHRLMGLDPCTPNQETPTVIVNVEGRTMGCNVNRVTQVMRIEAQAIQAPPETVVAGGAAYIIGFAKQDSELLILLDIVELLGSARLTS